MEEVHVCPVCMEPILDEGVDHAGQDALFCEGECQCWHHRWCAGVTKRRYIGLADTTEPFLCPSCTIVNQKATIDCLRVCLNALTDEVRAMKEIITVSQRQKDALTDEVRAMKEIITASQRQKGKDTETTEGSTAGTFSTLRGNTIQDASTETWSTVTRKGRGRIPHRRNNVNFRPIAANPIARNSNLPTRVQGEGLFTTPAQPTESQQDNGTVVSKDGTQNSGAQRVKACGVRRVWGTVKSCSSNTIKNTVLHLISTESVPQLGNVVVKRKYKRLPGNKIRWWFLMYMEEDSLLKLESEWEKVSLQTTWKLEHCHVPVNFLQAPPSPPQT